MNLKRRAPGRSTLLSCLFAMCMVLFVASCENEKIETSSGDEDLNRVALKLQEAGFL